jgi:hypothetical protein
MTEGFQQRLLAVDAALLTPLVHAARGNHRLQFAQWQVETLRKGGGQFIAGGWASSGSKVQPMTRRQARRSHGRWF